MKPHGRLLLLLLVLSTVLIQLFVAILLKELAERPTTRLWMVFILGGALALNALRMLVWGFTHRLYPLSHSYPLTALFFPCIMLLGLHYGEPVRVHQIAGVAVIIAGLVLMNRTQEANDA